MTAISDQYSFRMAPTLLSHETIPRTPSVQGMLRYWTTIGANEYYLPRTNLLLSLTNLITATIYTIGFFSIAGRAILNTIHRRTSEDHGYSIFLLGLFIIPIVILYVISHLWEPSFSPRYILISSLSLITMLAIFLSSIKSPRMRAFTTILMLICVTLQTLIAGVPEQRRPWGKVMNHLDSKLYHRPKLVLFGQQHKVETALPELKFHLGERDNKTVVYRSFDSLEKYILRAYTDNKMPGRHPREIILLMRPVDFQQLIRYLDDQQLGHSIEHFRTHLYLKYIRLHPN